METLKQFRTSKDIKGQIEKLKKKYAESSQYRMENYFNCVDDYSWGGILIVF